MTGKRFLRICTGIFGLELVIGIVGRELISRGYIHYGDRDEKNILRVDVYRENRPRIYNPPKMTFKGDDVNWTLEIYYEPTDNGQFASRPLSVSNLNNETYRKNK